MNRNGIAEIMENNSYINNNSIMNKTCLLCMNNIELEQCIFNCNEQNHIFYKSCTLRYTLSNRLDVNEDVCPLCRASINRDKYMNFINKVSGIISNLSNTEHLSHFKQISNFRQISNRTRPVISRIISISIRISHYQQVYCIIFNQI